MRRRSFLCLACQAALVGGAVATETAPEFGYSGAKGPSHWGALDPRWSACSAGVNQSPVDLAGFIDAELPPLEIHDRPSGREIVNNGHAIQVNAEPGSTLRVDGRSFTLLQFHFHAPSEHHLHGRSFPLEAHLVHRDAAGELAVVAVLFEAGRPNELLDLLLAAPLPPPGRSHALGHALPASGLLPSDRDYFRYNGSLTTPPCSEGVRWLVMKHHLSASPAQIAALATAVGFANNRPLHPVNARALLR